MAYGSSDDIAFLSGELSSAKKILKLFKDELLTLIVKSNEIESDEKFALVEALTDLAKK